MNKGGTGIGSASIILIFAVLCLTIFALISLSTARADKALADAEAILVKEYYEADTLAECILAELVKADEIPDAVYGVDIILYLDMETGTDIVSFSCPISDRKELYVEIAVFEDSYDILEWRMQDIGVWEIDDDLPVWAGLEMDESLPVWAGN